MKKLLLTATTFLVILALLAGCGNSQPELPADTEPSELTTKPTSAPTVEPTDEPVKEPTVDEYINEIYYEQIGRYEAPLWELWDASKYFENGLCFIPSYYYTGNSLENVGFGLVDLDNDGYLELVIGAILDADSNPSIFEIWTLVNGEPVMLAQGGSENRYLLQHVEEEQTWYVVNEISVSIASYATYYMKLEEGEFQIVQGILFDAFADEENPWFMTHDLDGDASNDTPIDEETANTILEANRQLYTAPEYFPYTDYPSGTAHPPQTTPEQLLYERVETLSQRFGLDIRIPEQSELSYTSYDAYALTDLIAIRSALDVLEENLSLYPEGFFRQLTYGPVESIRIELVGALTVKEGANIDPDSTNAFASNKGDYYLVVINGFSINAYTIFHEFSHIIDARLLWDSINREDALFSEAAWLALQPEGFDYALTYIDIPEKLLPFLESDYFLTWYSMTFPTEDRAMLLAAAMENEYQKFSIGSGRRAKLQFYADCIRDCFDTEGWPETTLWEQVLQNG